ncbi:MAG: hypothetical protein JJT77_02905 [Crocinitomicaceae bacterium]|nr:hypothetical protein [Crocinitomicaceae bacterium]
MQIKSKFNSAFLAGCVTLLFVACSPSAGDEVLSLENLDTADLKTLNKGDYIQIVDESLTPEKKTKRLINEDAQLALGQLHIILGTKEWSYVAFKKGGTSMHLSDNGLRLSVEEHNGFQWWCVLDNKNILAEDALGVYTPRETSGKRSAMQYFILVQDGEKQKWNWTSGKFYLEQFNHKNGEVSGKLIGEATNEQSNEVEKIEMRFQLRFEDVTSTVGFSIG